MVGVGKALYFVRHFSSFGASCAEHFDHVLNRRCLVDNA